LRYNIFVIDLKSVKENLEEWKAGLARKRAKVDLDALVAAYDAWAEISGQVEGLRAERNEAAKAQDIEAGKRVSGLVKEAEAKLKQAEDELNSLALQVPNIPSSDAPDGGEEDSQVVETSGTVPALENPKDHIDLGTSLGILDIERGVKTSGARFYFLKNEGVELEFALVRFVFDLLKSEGFELMVGPQLVNKDVMEAAGYLGQAEDEVYKTNDDLYLIGTSEQTMLGYHMNEVIEAPKRYAGFSTCFRREAGSYGKDVKGIIRTHQFDKVEMFSYVKPEDSATEHEFLVSLEEEILRKLEIPYQKVLIAAGDLGMAAHKKFDLESWIPSQKRYRETHSCSNCTDWQARGAKIRYKTADGKNDYVHTLNGTAVAIGRLLVALLENHQQADGSVKIPAILHPYLSFKQIGSKSAS
jgi:seryl-tRNA synthetase